MRARRTDANHAAVRDALRAVGAVVADLSDVGEGVPDLAVAWDGMWYLVEVKDGQKPPSARRLTPAQVRFIETAWTQKAPVYVVESVEQALRVIGLAWDGPADEVLP